MKNESAAAWMDTRVNVGRGAPRDSSLAAGGLGATQATIRQTVGLARPALARTTAFSAVVALALTGCATTHSYTPTYCLTHDQALPAEPPRIKSQLTGQADRDLEIVAGSALRLRAWGEGLNTILSGCREPSQPNSK